MSREVSSITRAELGAAIDSGGDIGETLVLCVVSGVLPTRRGADAAAENGRTETLLICDTVGVHPTHTHTGA